MASSPRIMEGMLLAVTERDREIEEKIDSAADALREFGLECALAGAVLWLGIVLGNPETYLTSRFYACLGATMPPPVWLGACSTLSLVALVAALAAYARPGITTGVARGAVLLVEGGFFVWIAALALCGRSGPTSLAVGLLWLFAGCALGRFLCLCASLARDGAALDDDDDTFEPEESDVDGG